MARPVPVCRGSTRFRYNPPVPTHITITAYLDDFVAFLTYRIGEPYISTRVEGGRADGRPHMGLGIFIAQTLLERTGAAVGFANSRSGGAQVVVRWNPPIFDTKG